MESTDDHFSLKWSNFRSSLTEGFHDLLQEETMVDVTLAAEGKFLQAHKLVLSVCSPYFKTLFKVTPCSHPIVILKDVCYHELSYMLEFMYKGEVGVKHEELPSFLKLAETLKVKGLAGEKITDEYNMGISKHPLITKVRKKRQVLSFSGSDDSDSNHQEAKHREIRLRKRKRRSLVVKSGADQERGATKKVKRRKMEERRLGKEDKEGKDGREGKESEREERDEEGRFDEDCDDGEDDNPLVRLIIGSNFGTSAAAKEEPANDSLDGNDSDPASSNDEDFDIPPMLFNPDCSADGEQMPQDGTKRRAKIWTYFNVKCDHVVCKACGKTLKGIKAWNAEQHLFSIHRALYDAHRQSRMMQKKEREEFYYSLLQVKRQRKENG